MAISNNKFDGNARAMLAFNLTSSSITNNDMINSTSAATADIRLFEGVNGLTITGNRLANGAGRALRASNTGSGSPDPTNVTFNGNSITGYAGVSGNGVQLDNFSGTLDASANYWGTSNPATVSAEILGSVDFSPLLDFNERVANQSVVGFQADFSSMTVHTLGVQTGVVTRINEAVGLLADGALTGGARTINLAAGAYSENVVLNKAATVQGAGTSSTLLFGTGSGTGFAITGSTDTLASLGIQNFAAGITAGAATTNLSLNDVKLTGNTSGGTLTSVPTVTFAGNNSAETFNISATQFSRAGENPLNYTGVTTLNILGQGGADLFNVLGSASGTTTNVVGGSGNDEFVVSSSANGNGLLTTMAGPIFIDGGAGTNGLVVSEAASTTADTVKVTSSTISSAVVPFSVTYQATGGTFNNGVLLLTGSAADHVNIESTAANAPFYAFTGAGNDVIVVSSIADGSGVLSGIAGAVFVDAGSGANSLGVSDQGNAAGSTVNVYSSSIVSSAAPASISYQATGGDFSKGVVVLTGSGNDGVAVHSEAAGSVTVILTGGGNDVFAVLVANTSAYNNLILDGGSGFDSLFVSDISGGGVKHIFGGFVEMDYAGFTSSFIFFQNTESVT